MKKNNPLKKKKKNVLVTKNKTVVQTQQPWFCIWEILFSSLAIMIQTNAVELNFAALKKNWNEIKIIALSGPYN